MRVAVMGAGAVGGYFGAKLARAGHEVWFISRRDRLKAFRTTGVRVESIEGDFEIVPVRAIRDPSSVGKVDLVLFTVKSTGTKKAAEEASPLVGPHTTVLSIQNGVDNESVLEEVAENLRLLLPQGFDDRLDKPLGKRFGLRFSGSTASCREWRSSACRCQSRD